MMHFIPFHINRAERSGRAEVLTGTAADALVFVHGRHFYCTVRTFVVDHRYGSSRAVAGTVAAADAFSGCYAILLNPHGMANMLHGFLFSRDGFDGTSRTDLAATCAFGTTVAALKRHDGLHEVLEICGGAQNIVRAT